MLMKNEVGASRLQSPLLSIIVPTFNRPRSLQRCLSSLARLDVGGERAELIIIDDGSFPPCKPELSELSDTWRITVLRQENSGPAAARNHGAKKAGGRFLAFLDDDCTVPPNWYQSVIRNLDEGAMLGGVTKNREPGILPKASQLLVDYLYHYMNRSDHSSRFFTSNNMIIPAWLFRKIGGFAEDFTRAAAEDRDLCARWLSAGYPLRYVTEIEIDHYHSMTPLSFFRQHFFYGYGSFTYHGKKAGYSSEKVRLEPFRFYADLVMFPFRQQSEVFPRAISLSLLLMISQIFNGAGYFWAWTIYAGQWFRGALLQK
jgi:glycosyltransferase involved in cell wall biosynthesis